MPEIGSVAATTQVARRPTPSPRTVLIVSSLGGFMAFVDATVVNVAFPDIRSAFPGTAIADLSWVLNAYNIAFAAFLVAAGRLADLLGRRRVYLLALAVFTISSAACAAAPTAGVLIGLRVVQAIGAALLVPSSLALVLHAYPTPLRARAVATVAAVGALAAGLGPALGGALVAAGSWRLVFLVNVPVGVIGYVLARRRLAESRQSGRRRLPDLVGALAFAVAIGALVLAVVQGDEWGWGSTYTVESFAAAVVLGAFVLRRSGRHRSPIIDLTLLRDRTFAVTNAASIAAAAGFFGYTLVNVLYLTEVWRWSVIEAGLAITPGPVVAILFARPAGRLAERFGHRPVLVAGGLLWAGAVLWFVVTVGPQPEFLAEWLPGMVLLGVGAGVLFPTLSAVAVASAPGEGYATATGLNTVARQVGAALGVAVVVAIIQAAGPADALAAFDRAWIVAASCLGGAAVCCLASGARRQHPGVDNHAGEPITDDAPVARRASADAGAPSSHVTLDGGVAGTRVIDDGVERESTAEFLRRVPIFAGLAPDVRASIAARSSAVSVLAGRWLFRAGAVADVLYVVRSGRMEVVGADGAVVRVVGRGAVLGELALLTADVRSASVRAARRSELLAVHRADFEHLLATNPATGMALTRELAVQLRDGAVAQRTGRAVPAAIALVALDAASPVAELGRRLAAELGRWGRTAVLDAAPGGMVDDAVGVYGPVLDRALAANDQVVLVVGRANPAWAQFCLQQADRVVAAGTGAGDATPVPGLRGCDLLSVDVAGGSAAMAGWARALDPCSTHVVRRSNATADVGRLARRLGGRSVGVVLAGGGARAFAHIGVLDELIAAGITIDRVGGASMGAYLGALFAMGHDLDEIEAICFDEWARRRPLRDYTVPRHSLIRGDRCRAMLRRSFGDHSIEELERGYFSVATELRTGELVAFRSGRLFEAVGASMAIPVLAPALIRGREILVDGGLVDNLPVASMAALGEGPIIAVDCKATLERSRSAGSGKMHPPSLSEVLARVLILGSADTAESARRHADWTITPRDPGIGMFEFHQIDAAREAGRAAVRTALRDAPAALQRTAGRRP